MRIHRTKTPTKNFYFGNDARSRMLRGALTLSKAVGITYGPHGRTVLLDRLSGLLGTKDGVTVAREVDPSDPVELMGCQILREASLKVNSEVGDGTTSTAIIAGSLLRELHKLVVAGYDPTVLCQELCDARDAVVSEVPSFRFPVESQEELYRIGMIACNGDHEVAEKLAEACMAVGMDGTVTLEDWQGVGLELVYQEGMEIDRGPIHPMFMHDKAERVFNDALVAVVGGKLVTVEDVKDILETASQWPDNPLVIFAEDIVGEALQTILMNDVRGIVPGCAIQSPGFNTWRKEYLKDIAALAGATFFDPAQGYSLSEWDAEWFGALKHCYVKPKSSKLVPYDDTTEIIEDRKKEIQAGMAHLVSEYDSDRVKERLAKLASSMCVIRVGGYTESEIRERRARIEDALGAIQAALRSGYVLGGGRTYLDLRAFCPDTLGGKALAKALTEPVRTLAYNAGEDPEVVLLGYEKVDDGYGWDPLSKDFRHLLNDPMVCDPADVVSSVITAAVSVARTLLLVEGAITHARRA